MRSAVVTGASTGIGQATALRLDADGWQVFAGVRREQDGEALRKAGSERLQPLTLEINVIGQVAVTKALLPMIRAARGRVIFVGSINGRMSLPFLSPYAVSKHALEAIGDSLRGEMRPFGVQVSIIEPGAVDTPMREKGHAASGVAKATMNAEQLQLYGNAIDRFNAAASKGDRQACGPEKVAGKIVHALTARRPRSRYLVGLDARGQAYLRWLLPDRLGDRIIAYAMRD